MTNPERLGKYQVTDVLGEGAMGVVYLGFDPGIGRRVALKTMRRSLLAEADHAGATLAQRFRNEAQAAGRLMHPGIVAVYDYGDEGDIAYIAMEFVEGSSLSRALHGGVEFTDDDILSLMGQLLDALGHAHGNGVLHRDVKPANLLLTKDGRLKVADFGIARIESAALTQMTSIVGTPAYMAPEQFLGKNVDRRADLYSAGVLLYQLLVGKTPFHGTTEALMYAAVHTPPPLPSSLPGFAHGTRWDEVVATALAKDPQQRYVDAAAFRQALVGVAGRPAEPAVSGDTIISVFERAHRPGAASPSTSTNWDQRVLQQVEASLAKHVGPMASLLVRRTAPGCADLPQLVARLAEQVTSPSARGAFLSQAAALTAGSTARAPSTHAPATSPSLAGAPGEALVAASAKLLAQHLGPIAPVLAKRAAAKAKSRAEFFAALEDAVTDAAGKRKLHDALSKLA